MPQDVTGWSVLVKGRAVEVDDPDGVRRVAQLPLRYWALGDKHHWIRIVPTEVTGRRIWSRTTPAATNAADEEVHDGARPDRR